MSYSARPILLSNAIANQNATQLFFFFLLPSAFSLSLLWFFFLSLSLFTLWWLRPIDKPKLFTYNYG